MLYVIFAGSSNEWEDKPFLLSLQTLIDHRWRVLFKASIIIHVCICLHWFWSYSQILDQSKKWLPGTNTLLEAELKKTFFLHHEHYRIISKDFSSWQTFTAWSTVHSHRHTEYAKLFHVITSNIAISSKFSHRHKYIFH